MPRIDPRRLRPAALARLLNSTPLGEVVRPHVLYRHRDRAGYRIGDGSTIDLLRYVAWLIAEKNSPKPDRTAVDYETLKERARARNAALSAAGRDIGEIPDVIDPDRRERAAGDFRFFCQGYFPETFHLPFAGDHLKVIAKIEQAVLHGGQFAMATPRGSGKTSIAECACLWAILYGHREFVCLIGSDEAHAEMMLDSIKVELEGNERLCEDFPEAVYPIRCLEGIANRCAGQTYQGRRTHIGWTAKEIILPTIPGSAASGAIIKVAGITGRIRGMKFKRADGRSVRPSLVVLDDPQTDESARSPSQCATRESILAGAVLGLAGPGRKIAAVCPCTVIRPGDMADNILDRDRHPEWSGERTKMVYTFPTDEKLWARYAEIRAEGLRNDQGIAAATEFYRTRRDQMDAGAKVAWPERFNPDEASAIQHAMNLRLQDEAAFWAEYQNEPLPEEETHKEMLIPDQVAGRFNGRRRGEVPLACSTLTMFIDVHKELLFYCVTAWAEDFTGYVVDYGTFPRQSRGYFALEEVRRNGRSLGRAYPGAGEDGAIQAGLEALVGEYLQREWPRAGGGVLRVDRLLVDMGYKPGIVAAVKHKAGGAAMMLAKGVGIRAGSRPIAMYRRRLGWVLGHHWYVPNVKGTQEFPHVCVDVNYWKTFVHARLAVVPGDPGALTLFGKKAAEHRLFADHVVASETWTLTHGHGREVQEWKPKPARPDNHWLDCLVGCAAAASMCGVKLPGMEVQPKRQRKRYTQEDLRRR